MSSSIIRGPQAACLILLASSAFLAGCAKFWLVEEATAAPSTELRDAGAASSNDGVWMDLPLERPKKRPNCKRPPPILRPGNSGYLNTLSKSAQHWSLVRYLADQPDAGVGDEKGLGISDEWRGAELAESDYFSGLKAGKVARIYPAGFAKVSAIRARYELIDASKHNRSDDESRKFGVMNPKEFRPVSTGVLSDNCVEVAPNDNMLLFSLLLTEKLALQAVAERANKLAYDERPSGTNGRPGPEPIPDKVYQEVAQEDAMWRPISTVRFRVVKLGGREPVVVSETPQVVLGDARTAAQDYELPYLQGMTLGETADSPVAIGLTNGYAVAVFTRDGKIPVFRKNICRGYDRSLGVKFWPEYLYSGDRSYQILTAPLSGSFEPGKEVSARCEEDEQAINAALKGISGKRLPPSNPQPK